MTRAAVRCLRSRCLRSLGVTLAVCTLFAIASAPLFAEAPVIANYALAAWPTETSVPGDVFAIAQDREGYLWLGTPAGLVRFDGSRFQPWTEPNGASSLPAWPTHALASAAGGGLWIGFGGGGGVARLVDGRVTRYLPADGAPPGVNALLEDRNGIVWAATGHGLFRFDGQRWSRLGAADGYDGEQAFSVYQDRLGRVWVGAAGGLYRRDHDHGSLQLIDRAATHVDSLIEDDAGDIWVTDRAAIVRKLGAAHPPRLDSRIRRPLPGWRLLRDGRGSLLVASFSGGLFRIASPTSPDPLLEPIVYEHRLRGSPRALFQDREENVWVGMRGGLLRLAENTFRTAGPIDGLNHDGVRTAAVDGAGRVWVATTHALNRFAGHEHESYPIGQTRALYLDRSNTMWVATDDRVGRYVNGRLVTEPLPGVPASRVNALATANDTLWLCTAYRGVVSWSHGALRSHRQPGESGRQCLSILADRQDRVWAGFTSGGVALHERGTVRAVTDRDGLAPGSVLQIIEGADEAVWLATSTGVTRYQHGRFTSITSANAPVKSVVPVLVEDELGYIWIGIHSGTSLMRFHAREMDKVAAQPDYRVAYTLFDENDGLQPGTQTWQSGAGAIRDAAGQLWVINGPGMTIIDPRQLKELPRPSPPRLDAVIVNGERITPAAGVKLANGPTVQIDYAALSLSATSKLRFRHVLDGVDRDWVYDGDGTRATYASLPAGDYRFRVSTTQDGQWTEPAIWTFTVTPQWYLSRWFLVVALATVAGSVVGGMRLRVRAVKHRYALVIAERTRVSREIHDTLLQSLAAIGPELEAVATRLPTDQDEVVTELRRIRKQVGRSVRDARDTILELRRHPMGTPRLADSLAVLADDSERRHAVRPTLTVEGRRPDHASPEVDVQLCRIAQEAVTNAIRHARASRIDITVAYHENNVTLVVADNGCGFTPGDPLTWRHHSDHFGLITMRERAEKIGGQLRVESAPGHGTRVETVAGVTSAWL
jgi:signal transduction histidine kinase/ligand-binding sensor domain-containing protein